MSKDYLEKYLNETAVKAIIKWGIDRQTIKAAEELSELIKELLANLNGRDNQSRILEEMADSIIMIKQMEIIFCDGNHPYEIIEDKLKKLNKRIESENQ